MYEQYLRDPASVGEEWRQLFDNGKLAELPVIPTDRAEVLRDEGRGTRDGSIASTEGTRPPSRVPPPPPPPRRSPPPPPPPPRPPPATRPPPSSSPPPLFPLSPRRRAPGRGLCGLP